MLPEYNEKLLNKIKIRYAIRLDKSLLNYVAISMSVYCCCDYFSYLFSVVLDYVCRYNEIVLILKIFMKIAFCGMTCTV